jgi:hypothetical protein
MQAGIEGIANSLEGDSALILVQELPRLAMRL